MFYRSPRLLTVQGHFIVGSGLSVFACVAPSFAAQPVAKSIAAAGTTYSTSFDTSSPANTGLANTGTNPTNVPAGFGFLETGTGSDSTYTVGTGSIGTGDTYSFGAASAADRALGGVRSGSVVPTLGAAFVNNSGMSLVSVTIAYTGEQWRLGTTGRADRLDAQYSTSATSIAASATGYTDRNALDFSSPITSGTVGALNGNAVANQAALTDTFVLPSPLADGGTFYLRWLDVDATGADDGLAIDDFSITFQAAPEPTTAGLVLLAGGGVLTRRRNFHGTGSGRRR